MPRIACIKKQDRYDPSERITEVGGPRADGRYWQLTQRQAIEWTEDPYKENFWVGSGFDQVPVIVRTSRFGNKYITTEADGESQNNLLSLPECRP